MPYNTYPAVDENYEFPPEVKQAMASSVENKAAIQVQIEDKVPGEVASVIGDGSVVYAAAAAAVDTALSAEDVLTGPDPRAPILTYEHEDWAIKFPDPDGKNAGGIRKDGTFEFHKVKRPYTYGVKTSMVSTGDSLVASSGWPEYLASQLSLPMTKLAWNGETSDGINVRNGSKKTRWFVNEEVIPSSGSVSITPVGVLDFSTANTYMSGSMLGVPGRITMNEGGNFAFVRDESGSSISAVGKVSFVSWPADYRNSLGFVLMGRNDVSQQSRGLESNVSNHVLSNYYQFLEYMNTVHDQVVTLGTLNRTTEPRGSQGYEDVLRINDELENRRPGKHINVRKYMVHQAIYDMGITPTSEDLQNMSLDAPPPSIMQDITHPMESAWVVTCDNLIIPWLVGKEFV